MTILRKYAIPAILFASAIAMLAIVSSTSAQEVRFPAYERSAFPHWQTRQCRPANHDALSRWASDSLEWRDPDRQCRVVGGEWFGVYGGMSWFNPRQLDTDHVVPLAYAWESGAWRWTRDERRVFANDPANMIPVSASLNRQKGAKGPVEWEPPREEFRCEYALRFVFVLNKYELPVSDDLAALLGRRCFNLE